MSLEEELRQLIDIFRRMADSHDHDGRGRSNDYSRGLDEGCAIAYRSAANHLDVILIYQKKGDSTQQV